MKKRLKPLSKKGIISDMLYLIIDIIFIMVIFIAIVGWIDDQLEDTLFEKRFLARDLALTVDTMQAFNNVLYVSYPRETFWFDYRISANKVFVSEKSSFPNHVEASFPFVQDKSIAIEETTLSPKEKPKIREGLLDKYLNIQNYFSTSVPEIKEENKVKIGFLRAGTELKMGDKKTLEQDSNVVFCQSSKKSPNLLQKSVAVGRMQNKGDDKKDTNLLKSNIIVSILHTKDNTPEKYVKIYIPYNSPYFSDSNSLACSIMNAISSDIKSISDVKGFSIIPKEADWLFADRVHLVIELVNIDIGLGNLESQISLIAEKY